MGRNWRIKFLNNGQDQRNIWSRPNTEANKELSGSTTDNDVINIKILVKVCKVTVNVFVQLYAHTWVYGYDLLSSSSEWL